MKMRFLIYSVFLVSLLLASPAKSQVEETIINKNRNNVVLKWAPVSLFDYFNTTQIGVEIPFKNTRLSFQQNFGYGHSRFSIWSANREDVPDRHNFLSRSTLRFYVREWTTTRVYLDGEYLFRKSVSNEMSYEGVGCSSPMGCSYYKEAKYKLSRLGNAVHAKFGVQTWLTPRVCLEAYSGIGLRNVVYRSESQELIRKTKSRYWWEYGNWSSDEPVPAFTMGIQLGLRLGK